MLALLAGCPGVLPEPVKNYTGGGTGGSTGTGGGGGTLPDCDAPTLVIQKDVAAGGCMGAMCHSTIFQPLFMTATKASLRAQKAATSMGCVGQDLINAADPASSVILKRVQGATCGEQMPSKMYGALNWLGQSDIDCIAGWVATP